MSKHEARHWLALALLFAACGGALGKPQGGGESHFLRRCTDSCSEGLECISELCTRGCVVGQTSCGDLSPGAVCTDQSIEPGAVAVCDVACSTNQDCAPLGTAFECDAGFCREHGSSPPPPIAGAGAGGAAAGGGGEGGAGEPPVVLDCTVQETNPCDEGEVCKDDPSDDRDADLVDACLGTCSQTYWPPSCTGIGHQTPCPDGLVCLVHPDNLSAPDYVGHCAGAELVGICNETMPCDEGFACDIDYHPGESVGNCVPGIVSCRLPTCAPDVIPTPCPSGYAHSEDFLEGGGSCFGACVRINECSCEKDADCPPDAVCSRASGICVPLWEPPALCSLPFDAGPCAAAEMVYAAVDGVCVAQSYGGCGGNENRFLSLEECLATCEGRPLVKPCPEGRERRTICLGCGEVGCGLRLDACAKQCSTVEDCDVGFACHEGVCSVTHCL